MAPKWYTTHSKLFDYITYVSYALYIGTALGLSSQAPAYLDTVLNIIQLYVAIFLVWRFNPWRAIHMTPLDTKIAFNGGVILLIASAMTVYNTYGKQNGDATQEDTVADLIS